MNRVLLAAVAAGFGALFIASAPATGVFASAPATAANAKPTTKSAPAPKTSPEKAFMSLVVALNLEEIQLGKLAQQKSENPEVKAFGERLVNDRTTNNTEAIPLAKKLGATVPTKISSGAQKNYDKLKGMSPTEFDKTFIDQMVKGHQNVIRLFEGAQDNSENDDIVGFAKNSIPVLEQHLDAAKKLQAANKVSG